MASSAPSDPFAGVCAPPFGVVLAGVDGDFKGEPTESLAPHCERSGGEEARGMRARYGRLVDLANLDVMTERHPQPAGKDIQETFYEIPKVMDISQVYAEMPDISKVLAEMP